VNGRERHKILQADIRSLAFGCGTLCRLAMAGAGAEDPLFLIVDGHAWAAFVGAAGGAQVCPDRRRDFERAGGAELLRARFGGG